MISICQPYIETTEGNSRLVAEVSVDDKKDHIWFEVDTAYEKYLCPERGDAFVVAILNYAMRNGHDIISKIPLGEDLFYQLEKILINVLCNNSKKLHRTKIIAPVDSSHINNAGAVGTGISCGIDSMHVLAEQTHTCFLNHAVTHLAFNNVGSHGVGTQVNRVFPERRENARKFCEEFHFKFIEGNSNLQEVITQHMMLSHTYYSLFPVFALQKLYSIYYYASSGYPYNAFSLTDNEKYDPGLYELLSLSCFSTPTLKIYSEGGEKNRFEKVKSVVHYTPSYRYLNVCLKQFHNCGKCEKCVRTLLGLDAAGKLVHYHAVFDVEYYRTHQSFYHRKLVLETLLGNDMYIGVYPLLKDSISLFDKGFGLLLFLKRVVHRFLLAIYTPVVHFLSHG